MPPKKKLNGTPVKALEVETEETFEEPSDPKDEGLIRQRMR